VAALAAIPKARRRNGRRRSARRNPGGVSTTQRLEKATKFYESFHWGDAASKVVRKQFSKVPRVGVKLGAIESIAYATSKGGEKATWEHDFGEEGGKRPDLVMDVDNERLHIVGGDYKVRPEGIVD
jgi:hypothetical protein